ncbi:MAG: hypothetical protein ACREDR_45060 [Blastocatellia bacterium]
MLTDSRDAAKYGWTHCLTMPQSAWALGEILPASSSNPSFRNQAARAAVSWVISLRAAVGNGRLNTNPELKPIKLEIGYALYESPAAAAAVAWHTAESDRLKLITTIASEAAVRTDAHLIKFTRACIDSAIMDPEQARLYYAAAAYLCAIWCDEESRETIEDQRANGTQRE